MTDHTPTPREHELPNGDLAVSLTLGGGCS